MTDNANDLSLRAFYLMHAKKYDELRDLIGYEGFEFNQQPGCSHLLMTAIERGDVTAVKLMAFSGKINFNFRNRLGCSFEDEARMSEIPSLTYIIRDAMRESENDNKKMTQNGKVKRPGRQRNRQMATRLIKTLLWIGSMLSLWYEI